MYIQSQSFPMQAHSLSTQGGYGYLQISVLLWYGRVIIGPVNITYQLENLG